MANTKHPIPAPDPEGLPFRIKLNSVNKGVGYVAFFLPFVLGGLTLAGETCFPTSISHYYFTRIGGDVLVGALCLIGVLMLFFFTFGSSRPDGYLRYKWYDPWLVRLAGLCAFVIAFVPTTGVGCALNGDVARAFLTETAASSPLQPSLDSVTGTISFDFWASFGAYAPPNSVPLALGGLHFGAAWIMFLILAYFSYSVFTRTNSTASLEPGNRKSTRNTVYRVLGVVILITVIALSFKAAALAWVLEGESGEAFSQWWSAHRLTFWFEAAGLSAFGLSWMIKGRFWKAFEDSAALP
jgi:hypothetical protein